MTPRPWAFLVAAAGACAAACASSTPPAGALPADVTMVRHVDKVGSPPPAPALAGARCKPGQEACACRSGEAEAESEPPAEGNKRLEIRMSADGGEAVLDSPGLGHFTANGVKETCFYVDVPAGSKNSFAFVSRAADVKVGVSPRLAVTEYGPAGPYWYKIATVECIGAGGRCDRDGAEKWGRGLQTRKRGRLDPCGSMVVTGLNWETSGGQAERDGGLFSDLTVHFEMEAKKFPTKFAPGSTECVPK
jgi:hypothetical protein